ncbi:MAG: response regulator [Candidatus Coatesbacteria bacterium]|nr:response regulator [Candidatus Coatesbacteria bacterium]
MRKPKTKILIVDDNKDHNDLQKDAVSESSNDYIISQALGSDECLDAIKDAQFDLIILDYTLPNMNGIELMDRIKSLKPDMPILMVTGHGDESIAVDAMKRGACDYLAKTPDMSFLKALPIVVKKALKQHELSLEKKHLEEQVRQTKDYLAKIIENAGEAVFVTDLSGKVLSVNRAGQRLFGALNGSLIKGNICDLAKDKKDREELNRALSAGIGETTRIDIQMIGPESGTLEVSVCISFIEVESDFQSIIIIRDMTEMMDMQQKLIEREKLAAIGELVGSVAHELNNKLGPILGYAELLQRSTKEDKAKQRLRVIEDSALKAKSIIEALLGFSRYRKPLRSYFNLNKVLRDAISLMEFQLRKNDVQLELHLTENLPDLFADSVQIQQILVNLLKNACQATQGLDSKKIEIETTMEADSMVFSVRDNGVGIPEFNLGKVFDPFFTTQKSGKGAGLGLSVAYGIVKEHEGDIILSSEEAVGTKITVRLPICDRHAATQPKDGQEVGV